MNEICHYAFIHYIRNYALEESLNNCSGKWRIERVSKILIPTLVNIYVYQVTNLLKFFGWFFQYRSTAFVFFMAFAPALGYLTGYSTTGLATTYWSDRDSVTYFRTGYGTRTRTTSWSTRETTSAFGGSTTGDSFLVGPRSLSAPEAYGYGFNGFDN